MGCGRCCGGGALASSWEAVENRRREDASDNDIVRPDIAIAAVNSISRAQIHPTVYSPFCRGRGAQWPLDSQSRAASRECDLKGSKPVLAL